MVGKAYSYSYCCCCVVLACCTGEKNKAISAAVCGALQQHLGVPPNRVYIRVRRAGGWWVEAEERVCGLCGRRNVAL